MYKIYINNAPLILSREAMRIRPSESDVKILNGKYLGKSKFFFPYIDYLEKNGEGYAVFLQCNDEVKAFEDFYTLFTPVLAGGGIVRNKYGEIAMIFRRGFWDLPKGKAEADEPILHTAIREVKEEIGLKHLEAKKHIITTYHTYRSGKGKRILKISTWFEMTTTDTYLTPQTSEDIERAEWVKPEKALSEKQPIFKNIAEVIQQYLGENPYKTKE